MTNVSPYTIRAQSYSFFTDFANFYICFTIHVCGEKLITVIEDVCPNFETLSDENKLIYIMSISDKELVKKVATFIHESFVEMGHMQGSKM